MDKPQVESLYIQSPQEDHSEKNIYVQEVCLGVISGSVCREVRNRKERKAVSVLCLNEKASLLITEAQSCWGLGDEV